MRLVLQRVRRAAVRVAAVEVGAIGRGVLVLLGVEAGDTPQEVDSVAAKVAALRLFEDGEGKMNLSTHEAGGDFLVVSQFTLAARLERGRRPSFDRAAPPAIAEPLYLRFVAQLRAQGYRVETGRFRAEMEVELVNDGPVTFVLDANPRSA